MARHITLPMILYLVCAWLALIAVAKPEAEADNEAEAEPERFIINFGDSYSSAFFNPNDTASPPTPENPTGNPAFPGETAAGGPTWAGILTKYLSPPGTVNWNFAYFGATIDRVLVPASTGDTLCFDEQVTEFQTNIGGSVKPSYAEWNASNSVFIVWFGINDIDSTPVDNYEADMTTYRNLLRQLHTLGARRFLLVQVPPFWRTPYIFGSPEQATVQSNIQTWNTKMFAHFVQFQLSNLDSQVHFYDPTATFNRILDNPTAYGASNNTCYNADGVSCLWWNNFHPGQSIHKALAADIYLEVLALGFFSSSIFKSSAGTAFSTLTSPKAGPTTDTTTDLTVEPTATVTTGRGPNAALSTTPASPTGSFGTIQMERPRLVLLLAGLLWAISTSIC